MKKMTLSIVFAAIVMSGTVFAVSPGKIVEYDGGPTGKVVFSGSVHDEAGYRCISFYRLIEKD